MIPFRFDAPPGPGPGWHEVAVPAGIRSKAALFEHLAIGLRFPTYFGHNWDALEECLNDLGWMGADRVGLVHADLPPLASESDRGVYVQILAQAARESERLSIFFPISCRPGLIDLLSGEP